jgi:hypothetical protein
MMFLSLFLDVCFDPFLPLTAYVTIQKTGMKNLE